MERKVRAALLLSSALFFGAACVPPEATVGGTETLRREIARIGQEMEGLRRETEAVSEEMRVIAQTVNPADEPGEQGLEMRVGFEALRAEMQILSAKLDEVNYQVSALTHELVDLREGREGVEAAPQTPIGASERLYHSAFSDFLKGHYETAVIAFQSYLERYPTTELADNVLYWLGECYLAQKLPEQALQALSRVIDEYPGGDKVPAALLRRGFIFLDQKKLAQGVMQLQHLIEQFPLTEESRQAEGRLEEMGLRGR